MRHWKALLAGLSIATGAAAADSNPLGLAIVETPELRLVYQSPALDFLVPHTLQTFTNSLRWQRERFGWAPSGPVTVMLKDFSDYGNAGATPLPFNTLRVEVSPASNAFETNPSSERMYSLMNHELVHIATTDLASSRERFWRGVFFGKVPAQPDAPESLLYSALTVPRFNVPRWLLEGSAVFFEIYDWHVRNQQPLVVARAPDGRYGLGFLFTRLILRPDAVSDFIGVPYDLRP